MRSDSMAALIICLCTIYDSIVGLPYTAFIAIDILILTLWITIVLPMQS